MTDTRLFSLSRQALTSSRTAAVLLAIALSAVAVTSCAEADPAQPQPEPSNNAPVAAAGPDQTVSATLPVGLDGSASSDADSDAITYSWSISSSPAGSAAALTDATTATPSLTPDVAGTFVVQLVVSDGTDDSAADEVTITAEDRTTSEMIDAGGGDVTSSDGSVVLAIPAAALASAENITMTEVAVSQRPEEFADVGADAIVYDLRPDGLTFDVPIDVTATLPASMSPTVSDGVTTIPVAAMATLSGGVVELAGDQMITTDVDAASSQMSGSIEHFSSVVVVDLFTFEGPARELEIHLTAPEGVFVGESFDVEILLVTPGWSDRPATARASATNHTGDPLVLQGEFSSSIWVNGPGPARGTFVCESGPVGTLSFDVTLSGFAPHVAGAPTIAEERPLVIPVTQDVECFRTLADFAEFLLTNPEGFSRIETDSEDPDPLVFAHEGGARLTDNAGAARANFSSAALAGASVFGAAGNPDDGVMVASQMGVHWWEGALPAGPTGAPLELEFVPAPQPMTGPDLGSHTTDVVTYGGVGMRGFAAVLFEDQDIAFFDSRTDAGTGTGFGFRDDLAETFKPMGTSLFGTDRPISVHVQPEGFMPDYPMLVLTVSNDADEETKLWRVEVEAGIATASHIDQFDLADGGRQVRCLDNICAVSSYGGFSFGNTLRFHWDGDDMFTAIPGFGGGRPIGLDIFRAAPDRYHIAETSFLNNSLRVTEVTAGGEFLNVVDVDLPDGCNSGHPRIRVENEVIFTCNASGVVDVIEYYMPG